jgi:hypothetical protein
MMPIAGAGRALCVSLCLWVGAAAAAVPKGDPFGALHLNGEAALTTNGHLQLNRGIGSASSAYTTTPESLTATCSFISTFTITMHPGRYHPQADGFASVIQNDPAGDMALGGAGSCLGVCDISDYAAIAFQIYSNNTAGLWLNGVNHAAI